MPVPRRPGAAIAAAVVALMLGVLLAACGATGRAAPAEPATPPATPAADAAVAAPATRAPERLVARARPPRPPTMGAALRSALVADHCVDRDLAAPPAVAPHLVVLDRSYALDPAHVPADLVPASAAGFSGGEGAKLVSAAVVDDLAAMRAAWVAAGLRIELESAYRSWGAQRATFDHWVREHGTAGALVRSARPGHSEHQLGTAIDVTSPGWGGRFGDWAVETAEGAWMAAHAWEYGFVMSYPAGAQATTCFSYEPWHYRWVGREVAARQHAAGIPLRALLPAYLAPDP